MAWDEKKRSYWLQHSERNLERGHMDTYQAILRAADHIQQQPRLFDFERTRIPRNCRTPGCALGWIGYFAGRTQARIRAMLGFSFLHRGIAIVTLDAGSEPVITVTAREFYERMDRLAAGDWRRDADQCARALRLYAAAYHQTGGLDPVYVAFREALLATNRAVQASESYRYFLGWEVRCSEEKSCPH